MTTTIPNSSPTAPVGPPPPFDAELAAALAVITQQRPSSVTPDLIQALRQPNPVLPRLSDEELRRGGKFEVTERLVPGPAGAPEVSLLICRPTRATAQVAAIYHTHGGGMIMGDNRTAMPRMLDWAEELQLTVVSVEYRLAPETPHPGPVEDCYAALSWTAEHADELGIDPGRIVIAGGSAGGGLAAAVTLMARDQGGPALAGQMLMCPMLDDRNDTPSARQMACRASGITPPTTRGGRHCWARRAAARTSRRTQRPPGRATCRGCRPRSST